ncbi:MAG: SMC-Scp complex subunit ScpB, partial [Gammaproteobacteria bacterium]
MPITDEQLKSIIEAAIMAAGEPLSIDKILTLFVEEKEPPTRDAVKEAIKLIETECETRGVELKKVSSGYRFQAKKDFTPWVSRLWEEKPARYSRALLETMVLIAYKQPLTRGEIEHVRGVAVSTHIIKTLLEREWVRVVGHRDVPGKPALYA